MSTAIVWFRQDLRLADNPALEAACASAERVVPLFVDDPDVVGGASRIGAASRVWLHHSLRSLDASLRERGSRLVCRRGAALEVLRALAEESGASRVFWNRCYDPETVRRDIVIKKALAALTPRTFDALLLFEPWSVLKKDGTPYKVYTPYWRAAAARYDEEPEAQRPLPAPTSVPGDEITRTLAGAGEVDALGLLPERDWHGPLIAHWAVGEAAASARLDAFAGSGEAVRAASGNAGTPGGPAVRDYDRARDIPAEAGTSRLSPHLHHGEISPRQVIARLRGERPLASLGEGEATFAKEVFWREFAYTLLHHFPDTVESPLDRRFEGFPWREDAAALAAWKRGRTGIPIVDAGMRELYATGWMHNRVRMIVASFLIKNLLLPWQQGEAWFRDCLVDADLASNTMGWQWTAGCGADAAPFFRVFNPVLQGERFDKAGDYVRRWVPELAALDAKRIHQPWTLPDAARAALDYPEPLVELKASRQRALDAFASVR